MTVRATGRFVSCLGRLISALAVTGLLYSQAVRADEVVSVQTVEAVVMANIRALEAEDMEAMMATIHTQSPNYQATQQQVAPLLAQYDIECEIHDLELLGVTEGYALVKLRQVTRKTGGEAPFQDNELLVLHTMKQEAGQWKFWSQTILEMEFL